MVVIIEKLKDVDEIFCTRKIIHIDKIVNIYFENLVIGRNNWGDLSED